MSNKKHRVGEIRPSQLMFTYGIGAIVDLPRISVIVTGLEDWEGPNQQYAREIVEERLLEAVRFKLSSVDRLLSPPIVPDDGLRSDPFDSEAKIGVPVATFPRWMVCPQCRILSEVGSGLFELKENPYHPDQTAYYHKSCNKSRKPPQVVPARFLVACPNGHLDDFPWVEFAHRGQPCESPQLRLIEYGTSGEARDLEVRCESCGSQRRLWEAFGEEHRENLPFCKGRRPHLRDYDPDGCEHRMRTVILGASNTWFPIVLSTVSIPSKGEKLARLVTENWAKLKAVTAPEVVQAFRSIGQLGGELSEYTNEELWAAIDEVTRSQQDGLSQPVQEAPDLRTPEWQVFTQYDPENNSRDFYLQPVAVPGQFEHLIDQVVLVERLREVRAMIGFSRLDALGELTDPDLGLLIPAAPISRQPPSWIPADEVRGEGIFIQFNEQRIRDWLRQPSVQEQGGSFLNAHENWRKTRRIENPRDGFPGMRYVFLHTFSHALMRQFALECGYASASIRERIYSRPAEEQGGPMAGLLIYTSAPDSEGTLGGLVSLGEPETLERHIRTALEAARLCANDPLCAEQPPSQRGQTLHAAACHACLFAPETSCERGNKYLDRSTLIATMEHDSLAFFE